MTTIHQVNCGTLHAPSNPVAAYRCLLLEDRNGPALGDTDIGLGDRQRLGQPLSTWPGSGSTRPTPPPLALFELSIELFDEDLDSSRWAVVGAARPFGAAPSR